MERFHLKIRFLASIKKLEDLIPASHSYTTADQGGMAFHSHGMCFSPPLPILSPTLGINASFVYYVYCRFSYSMGRHILNYLHLSPKWKKQMSRTLSFPKNIYIYGKSKFLFKMRTVSLVLMC